VCRYTERAIRRATIKHNQRPLGPPPNRHSQRPLGPMPSRSLDKWFLQVRRCTITGLGLMSRLQQSTTTSSHTRLSQEKVHMISRIPTTFWVRSTICHKFHYCTHNPATCLLLNSTHPNNSVVQAMRTHNYEPGPHVCLCQTRRGKACVVLQSQWDKSNAGCREICRQREILGGFVLLWVQTKRSIFQQRPPLQWGIEPLILLLVPTAHQDQVPCMNSMTPRWSKCKWPIRTIAQYC
jgi:hypothetical protein